MFNKGKKGSTHELTTQLKREKIGSLLDIPPYSFQIHLPKKQPQF